MSMCSNDNNNDHEHMDDEIIDDGCPMDYDDSEYKINCIKNDYLSTNDDKVCDCTHTHMNNVLMSNDDQPMDTKNSIDNDSYVQIKNSCTYEIIPKNKINNDSNALNAFERVDKCLSCFDICVVPKNSEIINDVVQTDQNDVYKSDIQSLRNLLKINEPKKKMHLNGNFYSHGMGLKP